ncbi:hypothetical protein BHM03_00060603 [Ensete ventricosum]|nr:hypothetical protein BHM03_00060603 [Ensete ventricosum]
MQAVHLWGYRQDGDVIDCVPFHLQPAFDHPRLKGLKPMVPEISSNMSSSTPHRPYADPPERPRGHEASDLADGEDSIQLWRTSGETCPEGTVPIRRTKEEDILRASSVRRFGRKPAARTRRVSEGSGHEDPSHGHWWLEFGSGVLVGYWPSSLFSHLAGHATMVQYGGEIFNTRPSGSHTATQMGNGHHAGEGFGRAAYFRNLQVVDWDNSLIPVTNLRVLADHPNCYDVQARINRVWGSYFYFGGPGRSVRCP